MQARVLSFRAAAERAVARDFGPIMERPRPSQPTSIGATRGGDTNALNHWDTGSNFRFWRGASGNSYVHSAYTLIGCPDIGRSVCLLVRNGNLSALCTPTDRDHDHDGVRDGVIETLAVLRLENAAASLNLAHIRQMGASIGANEVHVHVLGETAQRRRLIELDLRAGLIGSIHPHPRTNAPAASAPW